MTDEIKEYRMAGDGIQAPGAIVIRRLEHNKRHPYVVHFRNDQCGGYCDGDYCENYLDAWEAYDRKCKRYDPTGDLHRTFLFEMTTSR